MNEIQIFIHIWSKTIVKCMFVIDLILSFFLPSDSRGECLGDLYEGYFVLRDEGKSKFISYLITIVRAIFLIWAALLMRWDDIMSSEKDGRKNLDKKVSCYNKGTNSNSNSQKPALSGISFSNQERDLKGVTAYELSCKFQELLTNKFKIVKYLLLFLLSIAIAYILSTVVGVPHFGITLVTFAFGWLWRLGVILLCLIAVTMIYEYLR